MRRLAAILALVALGAASCSDDSAVPPSTTSPSITAPTTTTSPPTMTTTTLPASSVPSTAPTPVIGPAAAEFCALTPLTAEPVVVASSALTEISGIAASRQHDRLLWAHNDSGDSARLHLIDADTGADLGVWPLEGASAFDWEDMAIHSDAAGVHRIYVADLGDNFRIRRDIRIYRVVEPADPTMPAPLSVEEFIFIYPDGPTDAESLFVDPETGDVIIVSKSWDDSPTSIYRGPADTPPATPTELEKVGEVDLSGLHPLATAAEITADGRVIGLRTINEVLLWDRPPGVDVATAMAGEPCLALAASEAQGEALTFLPDGSGYITISEGDNPPVHWFRIDSAAG